MQLTMTLLYRFRLPTGFRQQKHPCSNLLILHSAANIPRLLVPSTKLPPYLNLILCSLQKSCCEPHQSTFSHLNQRGTLSSNARILLLKTSAMQISQGVNFVKIRCLKTFALNLQLDIHFQSQPFFIIFIYRIYRNTKKTSHS